MVSRAANTQYTRNRSVRCHLWWQRFLKTLMKWENGRNCRQSKSIKLLLLFPISYWIINISIRCKYILFITIWFLIFFSSISFISTKISNSILKLIFFQNLISHLKYFHFNFFLCHQKKKKKQTSSAILKLALDFKIR